MPNKKKKNKNKDTRPKGNVVKRSGGKETAVQAKPDGFQEVVEMVDRRGLLGEAGTTQKVTVVYKDGQACCSSCMQRMPKPRKQKALDAKRKKFLEEKEARLKRTGSESIQKAIRLLQQTDRQSGKPERSVEEILAELLQQAS